jgi:hypothetical protein
MKRNKLLLTLFVLLAFAGNAIAQFGPIGFDFKDPYVEFDNLRFAVRLSTVNNIYCSDPNSLHIEKTSEDELTLSSDVLSSAGGQLSSPGKIELRITKQQKNRYQMDR